jgi:excisionase family DNA binding protein
LKAAFKERYAKMANSSINPLAGAENFPALLTKKQASLYIQATPRFLERMVKSGRLRALKPSAKLWRVRRIDLEKFLESGSSVEGWD